MTSPTKFYHVTQTILQIWSRDQGLITLAFLLEKLSQPQFCKDLTRKKTFFERWSWFKLNNLGMALVMASEFYTSAAKGVRLKVKKILGLISTFPEDTGEKLVGETFCPPTPPPS